MQPLVESSDSNGLLAQHSAANFLDSSVLSSSCNCWVGYVAGIRRLEMEAIDLEVLSVLFFQQWLEATEHSQWDEAVMALYKLQAIEHGEKFRDLAILETGAETDNGELKTA